MGDNGVKELEIIYYGNPILRKRADEVDTISAEIKELVEDMFYTMYKKQGIGLAAPQVGMLKRVIVLDLKARDENSEEKYHIINPEITFFSEDKVLDVEGCLSIPGIYMEVPRSNFIVVKGIDINGKKIELKASGLLARVIQHEVDHLNGVLFVDYLTREQKADIQRSLKEIRKRYSNIIERRGRRKRR